MFGVTQGDLPDRLDPQADAHRVMWTLPLMLLAGLVVKVGAILAWGHLSPDLETIKAWCMALARLGPYGFFTGADLPTIAPGTLHPLGALLTWPLGVLWRTFDPAFAHHASAWFGLWVRVPTLLAEVAACVALYRLSARHTGPKRAVAVVAAFFLNPAVILGSSVWGHSDALILALVLGGAWQIVEARHGLGVALVGAAGLVHVHAFVFLPVAVVVAAARVGWARVATGLSVVAVGALLLGCLLAPSAPGRVYLSQPAAEPYTTYHAFNIWYPLGNLENGEHPLVPKVPGSRHAWGLAVVLCLMTVAIFKSSTRDNDSDFLRELFLLAVGVWLFGTRIHARYLLYPLAVLALFPGHQTTFWLLSISATLNVAWPLGISANWGAAVMGGWGNFLAAANLVLYLRMAMSDTETSGEELHYDGRPVEGHDHKTADWLEPEGSGIVSLDRADLMVLLVLTLAFGYLRYVNLAAPPDQIFDEIYHARAAQEIWTGKAPNEWVHPPLAKLLIGGGIKLFGMNSFGWRFLPWLAGCLVLPVLYILARNVIPDRRCALVATLLFAFDGCYFVMSRTAMTNVFALLWQIGAITCFLLYLKQASVKGGRMGYGGWLLATGALCGLGVATRWTCLWLIAFLSLLYAAHTTWQVFVTRTHTRVLYPSHKLMAYVLAAMSGLVHFYLIPGAMYLAAYYPLVKNGAYPDYDYVVTLQPQIWNFHTTFTTHHPYYSQWYTWCFTYRPVWYHYKDESGIIHGILALGNPILWWISLPAIVAATWLAIKERSWLAGFACVSWAALYLPWVLSPRVLNYSHYYLEPLPYACVAIGWICALFCRRDKSFWLETTSLLVIVAMTFAFFYPIYSCTPLPRRSYDMRIWSRTWI